MSFANTPQDLSLIRVTCYTALRMLLISNAFLVLARDNVHFTGVSAPTRTVTLIAEPSTIERGQSVTQNWTPENATDMDLQPEVGKVPAKSSQTVTPQNSSTYTLTVTGPGGSNEDHNSRDIPRRRSRCAAAARCLVSVSAIGTDTSGLANSLRKNQLNDR